MLETDASSGVACPNLDRATLRFLNQIFGGKEINALAVRRLKHGLGLFKRFCGKPLFRKL